jgi:hypothetical protein
MDDNKSIEHDVEPDMELAEKLMSEFVERAMKYGFDSIQVNGSVMLKNGDTRALDCGRGNWFSRVGLVREFLNADKARTASYVEHSEFQIDLDEGEF